MGAGSNRVDSFPEIPDLESSLPISAQAIEIHKVSLPQRKKTLPALKQDLGEVFFPDDPLNQFKHQSFFRKLVLVLHYLFPILQWGSKYSLQLFKADVVSGLTIASLAIPQVCILIYIYFRVEYVYYSFSSAGHKLCKACKSCSKFFYADSSFVPPLIYAVLGSSRDLAVGPVSIASLVMGSMLREEVSPDKEPFLYLQLAFTATFFAGVFQASLGFLRLGFIVDFLSKPTLIGFMGGSAIIVSLQQLKGLLGIVHFTTRMGFMRSRF